MPHRVLHRGGASLPSVCWRSSTKHSPSDHQPPLLLAHCQLVPRTSASLHQPPRNAGLTYKQSERGGKRYYLLVGQLRMLEKADKNPNRTQFLMKCKNNQWNCPKLLPKQTAQISQTASDTSVNKESFCCFTDGIASLRSKNLYPAGTDKGSQPTNTKCPIILD